MPVQFARYWSGKFWCHKQVPWSINRGPCRFERGHETPCKPGRRQHS